MAPRGSPDMIDFSDVEKYVTLLSTVPTSNNGEVHPNASPLFNGSDGFQNEFLADDMEDGSNWTRSRSHSFLTAGDTSGRYHLNRQYLTASPFYPSSDDASGEGNIASPRGRIPFQNGLPGHAGSAALSEQQSTYPMEQGPHPPPHIHSAARLAPPDHQGALSIHDGGYPQRFVAPSGNDLGETVPWQAQAAERADDASLWIVFSVCGIWRGAYSMMPQDRHMCNLQRLFNIPSSSWQSVWRTLYPQTTSHTPTLPEPPKSPSMHIDLLIDLWKYSNRRQTGPSEDQVRCAAELFSITWEDAASRLGGVPDNALELRRQRVRDDYGGNQYFCTAKLNTKLRIPARKNPEQPYVCVTCYRTFDKRTPWRKHEEKNFIPQLFICPVAGCPKESKVFTRKNCYEDHAKKCHKNERAESTSAEYAKITDLEFDRLCPFKSCNINFESWDERVKHVAWEFTHRNWTRSDWKDGVESNDSSEASEGEDDSGSNEDSTDGDSDNDDGDDGFDQRRGRNDFTRKRHRDESSGTKTHKTIRRNSNHNTSSRKTNSRSAQDSDIGRMQAKFGDLNISVDPFTRANASHLQHPFGPSFLPLRHLIKVIRTISRTAATTIEQVQCHNQETHLVRKTVRTGRQVKHGVSREAFIMQKLDHPHVVKHIASHFDGSSVKIVMEPLADTDLCRYMLKDSALRVDSVHEWRWFSCLASGLSHIHERGVQHGDINPSNVLISGKKILFTDFGMSSNEHEAWKTEVGYFTKQYAPPEYPNVAEDHSMDGVEAQYRGKAWDIWSLGFVFLELLTFVLDARVDDVYDYYISGNKKAANNRSFANNPEAVTRWVVSLGKVIEDRPKDSVTASRVLDVCKRMIHRNSRHRPTAEEVKSWLEGCSYASPKLCPSRIRFSTMERLSIGASNLSKPVNDDLRRDPTSMKHSTHLPCSDQDISAYSEIRHAEISERRERPAVPDDESSLPPDPKTSVPRANTPVQARSLSTERSQIHGQADADLHSSDLSRVPWVKPKRRVTFTEPVFQEYLDRATAKETERDAVARSRRYSEHSTAGSELLSDADTTTSDGGHESKSRTSTMCSSITQFSDNCPPPRLCRSPATVRETSGSITDVREFCTDPEHM